MNYTIGPYLCMCGFADVLEYRCGMQTLYTYTHQAVYGDFCWWIPTHPFPLHTWCEGWHPVKEENDDAPESRSPEMP